MYLIYIKEYIFSQKYLLLGEKMDSRVLHIAESKHAGISIHGFRGSWTEDGEDVLRNISLNVKPGNPVFVVGRVGAGKVFKKFIIHRLQKVMSFF